MTVARLGGVAVVDRNRPIEFTFDGRRYQGLHGDTLASALVANGVRVVARSFKLHRPRGILGAGLEEPNALVTVTHGGMRNINVRATEVQLVDGLVAHSQNCWPSVRFDLGHVLDLFAPLLPAGFYHKTLMWPSWAWYEGMVRKLAGSGRAAIDPDPGKYAQRYLHCDVLIVGAGPAGLAAAESAAERGLDVVVLERDVVAGGSALFDRTPIDGQPPAAWIADRLRALAERPNVQIRLRTLAFGHYESNLVAAVEEPATPLEPYCLWKIRAQEVVLATGAIERPLIFTNNDRPGIMLASAVLAYARRYAVCLGDQVVVFTNNDSAYETAFALRERGVSVVAIVDVRPAPGRAIAERARELGLTLLASSVVVDTRGRKGVRSVRVASCDSAGTPLPGTLRSLDCNLLCVSGGWNPTVHLYSQAGGKLVYDEQRGCFVPDRRLRHVSCVGAAAGEVPAVAPVWRVPAWGKRDLRHRQWVDLAHDVTVSDLELAASEGFGAIELAKRYTGTGMAADQGKTSNVNALAIVGAATGRPPAQVGTTTFRPPFHPVRIGAFTAGRTGHLSHRFRRLPVDWHEQGGAVLEDHSGWLRPACYLRPGETEEQAIDREVRAARRDAVLFDSSSLGKLEVVGPDAAEFLNRLYVNNVKTLRPGCLRYGLMLNDAGIIIDDGVFACLRPGHYLVNTSSAGALNIHFWMEEWLQCEWRDLRVWVAQQTAQWATLTVSGPRARAVIAALGLALDLDPKAFAHMQIRETEYNGAPIRVRRASFTGEVSYELDVPADRANALWQRLLELGAPYGITPLGMEALDRLRVEKGFLEVGVDTDGETSPLDVGWAQAVERKTEDFIGRRSLQRAALRAPDRLQLVGLLLQESQLAVPVGTHAVGRGGEVEGHVTSSCMSPHLNRSVALAMVRRGLSRKGESVMLDIAGRRYSAAIVDTAFFDPRGERLHG